MVLTNSSLYFQHTLHMSTPFPMAIPHEVAETVAQNRALLECWAQQTIHKLPMPSNIEEFQTKIKLSGWISHTRVFRPKNRSSGKLPLIVYFHGGGLRAGSPSMLVRPARYFASTYNAVVVCPSYRLVPEQPWPQPMRSAWEVLSHLSRHAERDFGAKLDDGFIVGGVSAGATLSSVALGIDILASGPGNSDEKLARPLTGVFLNCPLFFTDDIVPDMYKHRWTSRHDNAASENMTTPALSRILAELRPDVHSPWFSFIHVLERQHDVELRYRPPIFLQACYHDPLRDDSIIMAEILRNRGFPVKMDMMPDDGHAACVTMPWEAKSQNPTMEESTMEGMRWLLEGHGV